MKKILIFIAFATLLFCGCVTKTQEPEIFVNVNDTIDVIVDSVDGDSTIIVVGD